MNHNRHDFNRLKELQYPATLRADGRAEAFVDDEGDIYLYPLEEHDLAATEALYEAGLTDGEVVTDTDGEQVIKYPVESDIISLASVLNSLEGSQHRNNADVKPLLVMVGKMLEATSEKLEKLPASLSLADLAINRTTGQAELVAPYILDQDENQDKFDLFMGLCSNILQRASTKEFEDQLSGSIDRVIVELGWHHGA